MSRLTPQNTTPWAMLIACLLATSWGCAQCGSPYDYCGPTFTGGCGDGCGHECDARYRAGSILYGGGYGDMVYEGEYDGEPDEGGDETYYEGSSSYDVEEYDDSGRPAELHLTAEQAYGYETPEYARRPPASFQR